MNRLHPFTPTGTPCGCIPVLPEDPQKLADALQAMSIARALTPYGVTPGCRAVTCDPDTAAVVLRVQTRRRGLWSLVIPQPGRAFPVHWRGERTGTLEARRVPATTDTLVAALFAAYLRDRGALDFPAVDPRDED